MTKNLILEIPVRSTQTPQPNTCQDITCQHIGRRGVVVGWDQSIWHSIGQPRVCDDQMEERLAEERRLWEAIPHVPDAQCMWQVLLQSSSPRANHTLRTLPPKLSEQNAQGHDEGCGTRRRLSLVKSLALLRRWRAERVATFPMRMGGLWSVVLRIGRLVWRSSKIIWMRSAPVGQHCVTGTTSWDTFQGTWRVASRLAAMGIFHFQLLLPEVVSIAWPHKCSSGPSEIILRMERRCSPERALARVCREAGARVMFNVCRTWTWMSLQVMADASRCQHKISHVFLGFVITSPLTSVGEVHPSAADTDGVVAPSSKREDAPRADSRTLLTGCSGHGDRWALVRGEGAILWPKEGSASTHGKMRFCLRGNQWTRLWN